MKNNGGPAFPGRCTETHYHGTGSSGFEMWFSGMSLRDWFAGMALQGLLSPGSTIATKESAVKAAYEFADTMIKERENDSTS